MTAHIVQYSGGIGSWATAMRVAEQHGTKDMILLIADSKAEDADLWRFVTDSSRHLGLEPVVVADGRTPWGVFADHRYLGNAWIAPCTYHLKQKPCRRWLDANHHPDDAVLYVGIDASEQRRTHAITKAWQPWKVEFPMCEPPYLSKKQMLDWARSEGVRPPRMYGEGFSHNNCAGMCVRAGQRQWLRLLKTHPQRYAYAEQQEQQMRAQLGNVAILKQRRGGISSPLTLTELRLRSGQP